MANNSNLVGILVLGVLTVSLVLFLPVHATVWVGNDDGEFDGGVGAPTPSYVFVQEAFSTSLAWSSSPPNNRVSLQYNPDYWTSLDYQTYGDWFQTGIVGYAGDCVQFTIQVYSLYTGTQVWSNTYPSGSCLSVNQLYEYSNSIWYIQENGMNSCCDPYVKNVYFSAWGSGSPSSYTMYPPETWKWLRSNICWCGTDGGSTTFTSAGGTSQMGSNQNLYAISPPVTVSTAENSNMPYGQFSGSGTMSMTQSFGWPPPPPPCGCGGGHGH
jgi:hypothetical protein